ncbi:hypothetical protein T05_12762 [Trichinella murrelli]|uniref:Uncharacterized protein n=1 Tax=Trichinella murrelli TaxID=144512 RepID=A0A0V0THT2_9BILA|nr:hypothetical protein T05_12762 [Trichinella murrelli]
MDISSAARLTAGQWRHQLQQAGSTFSWFEEKQDGSRKRKNRPSMTRPLPLQLNNGMEGAELATAGGHSRCVLPALNQALTIRRQSQLTNHKPTN